jgi:alpha-mannosidase
MRLTGQGFSTLLVKLFACLSILLPAVGHSQTLWQIGTFDHSPLEFSSEARDQITFEIGKSDPQQDWSSFQAVDHPYRIRFLLDSVRGLYVLRIAALVVQPRVPVLQVDINGHVGTFFLHAQLSYFPGDVESTYHPNHSQADLEIEIPTAFLRVGVNTISLTCSDVPPSREKDGSSGIAYDALALDQNAAGSYDDGKITADMKPTIFYRSHAGGLVETIDAFVRFNEATPEGVAELQLQNQRYQAKLPGIDAFGERRISFEVPEWTGAAAARLIVNAGRKIQFAFTLHPERKWTLFVVPHTHLDIGFTDYQGKVAETQARVLTQAAELIHEHPAFRFSMDGSWNLQQLLSTRPKPKQEEILSLIRSGKMAMPAQYCNLLTAYASLETLYRSLYNSKSLSGAFGIPFEYANITDVPTYSGSYPSVLADSGVKYWVAASNNYRAPLLFREHWNEKSPFWWEGPDGNKVLFWYSWAYLQVQTLFGLPPTLPAVQESLPIFLQAYSKPTYKPDVALIYGTQVENTDLFASTATFATDWNKTYVYPKLTYASFPEFFHYVESHFGSALPTFRGDGGAYWEDGIASDAYFAAEDRANQNRVLSAEILSSVNHSIDPNLNLPTGLLAEIWNNIMLFAEHTWLSYNSVVQPDHEESVKQVRVKDDRADRASLDIEDAMNRALSQLADEIHVPANTLVVFNSLNWSRDALVETDLLLNPRLIDLTTEQQVPLETLYQKEKFVHVRFLARDLPSVGYKCFRIEYGKQSTPPHPGSQSHTVENAFYRITFDDASGAIAHIYDKQLQRELVDAKSPYKFGQCLYVTGGDRDTEAGTWQTVLAYGGTQIIKSFLTLPKAELTVHAASNGRLLKTEHQPWGTSIVLTSSALNTPTVEMDILLFDSEKKIEIRYRLHKDYTTKKEAVYFAFPVATAAPQFAYSSQQGWIDPAHDLMRGAGVEWFSVQHWMAAHDANVAVGIVPIDAPIASFGDINRGQWPERFHPESGTLFSYVMNNYWDTNYRAGQQGDFVFRYAITSARTLDGGALSHLGMEEMRPVEVDHVVNQDKTGNPERPLTPAGQGFLDTEGDGISLITWKSAENGDGSILRFAETRGKPTEATVRLPHCQISSAYLCTGVEDDKRPLPIDDRSIHLSFKKFQVLTVRIVTKP